MTSAAGSTPDGYAPVHSGIVYDGKLHGIDGLGRQEIAGSGAVLRVVEVPH